MGGIAREGERFSRTNKPAIADRFNILKTKTLINTWLQPGETAPQPTVQNRFNGFIP
jgi:hypothetical protein